MIFSRVEPGGLADCAFQYCGAFKEWIKSVYQYFFSTSGRNSFQGVHLPCLCLEVIKEEKLMKDYRSLADAAEFQPFVELEPSRERSLAFEGNLNKWKRFLEEFEKQLTRLIEILESKDDLFTDSENIVPEIRPFVSVLRSPSSHLTEAKRRVRILRRMGTVSKCANVFGNGKCELSAF